MLSVDQLDNAFAQALSITCGSIKFDTFKFRKGFEEDASISEADKEQIIKYLGKKMPKGSTLWYTVKKQIDNTEFLSTDYYVNRYPRKFRGAYNSVILKTVAGIMSVAL
ncbi:MAG: hypothetical protein ACI3W5_14375 [Faecousia sp.]